MTICDEQATRPLPLDRLETLGRRAPRRKPEGGPAELTSRHRLMISYMIDGCQHRSVLDRIWVERPVIVDGNAAVVKRRPEPGEPLSLIEAADLLRIRRRNARELMTLTIFKKAYDEELHRYREGEKAASLRTVVQIRDDPGLGKAADRKVRLQASQVLLGEAGGNTSVNVAVGVGLVAGYVLDLEERDEDQPLIIEHGAER